VNSLLPGLVRPQNRFHPRLLRPSLHVISMSMFPSFFRGLVVVAVSMGVRAADATNAPVSIFPDKRLEAAVRQQVFAKRASKDPLTADDVGTVSTVSAPFAGITNLSGLEHCRSLALFEAPGNRISDLRPLGGLKQLQSLNLASNTVKVIAPLAGAPALQYVELSHNQIADIGPLGSLSNLSSVYLSGNRLVSASVLTNLPRLTTVYLDGNRLTELNGFGALHGITTLSAARNRIGDLDPVGGFRAPFYLNLAGNRIHDLAPLQHWMTNDLAGPRSFAPFVRIYLADNPLSRSGRRQMESLKALGARINPDEAK
jgi:internalin A